MKKITVENILVALVRLLHEFNLLLHSIVYFITQTKKTLCYEHSATEITTTRKAFAQQLNDKACANPNRENWGRLGAKCEYFTVKTYTYSTTNLNRNLPVFKSFSIGKIKQNYYQSKKNMTNNLSSVVANRFFLIPFVENMPQNEHKQKHTF